MAKDQASIRSLVRIQFDYILIMKHAETKLCTFFSQLQMFLHLFPRKLSPPPISRLSPLLLPWPVPLRSWEASHP